MINEDIAQLTARVETVEDRLDALDARADLHTRQLAHTRQLVDQARLTASEALEAAGFLPPGWATTDQTIPSDPPEEEAPAPRTGMPPGYGLSGRYQQGGPMVTVVSPDPDPDPTPELILVISPPDADGDPGAGQVLVRVRGDRWWVDFRPVSYASWTPHDFFPGTVEVRDR